MIVMSEPIETALFDLLCHAYRGVVPPPGTVRYAVEQLAERCGGTKDEAIALVARDVTDFERADAAALGLVLAPAIATRHELATVRPPEVRGVADALIRVAEAAAWRAGYAYATDQHWDDARRNLRGNAAASALRKALGYTTESFPSIQV